MCRNPRFTLSVALAVAFGSVTFGVASSRVRAADPGKPAGKLIVHEWGTFTSFSGSDGVNLEFRPLATNDLPQFVTNPYRQPGTLWSPFLKRQFPARQRMETPVTYFYTDVPRSVNVRVDFPKGMLSEWYPVVRHFDAGKDDVKQTVVGGAYLDWGAVRLTPPGMFADVRVRGPNDQPVPASLPVVSENDHYGRARETDSAIVETVDVEGGSHFEKFLFYRGLGNCDLPIKLTALGNDRFQISNAADDASGALLLMRIENGRVRFTKLVPVGPKSTIEATLPTAESTVDQLAEAMVYDLTAAGLYEKESLAMVNTWRTSWFGENGTRLLYLVPGKFTDGLLPLTIDPAPDESVRVLVGRLETLTPEDCQRLHAALTRDDSNGKQSADTIRRELEPLGRFAEPALAYLVSQAQDSSQRARLEEILAGVRTNK